MAWWLNIGGNLMKFDFIKLKDNFAKRNITVLYFETFNEVKEYILQTIPTFAEVGIGHSQTLQGMNITELLKERGNTVFDKELGKNKDEVKILKKRALLTDYYISSANAVSEDGRVVNIDHSGNRVAAMIYGPDKVIIIVGINKITKTKQEAILRAKNIASPKNAKRAGYNPPCVEIGRCVDCVSSERVCNVLSIIEGQHIKDRMTIIVVNEEAGF